LPEAWIVVYSTVPEAWGYVVEHGYPAGRLDHVQLDDRKYPLVDWKVLTYVAPDAPEAYSVVVSRAGSGANTGLAPWSHAPAAPIMIAATIAGAATAENTFVFVVRNISCLLPGS
jgi:hypothetical protein